MENFINWPFAFIVVGGLATILGFFYKMYGGSIKDCPRNPALTINFENMGKDLQEFKITSKENWEKIEKKLDKLMVMLFDHIEGGN